MSAVIHNNMTIYINFIISSSSKVFKPIKNNLLYSKEDRFYNI